MTRTRLLLMIAVIALLAACGPRRSGLAPAENALSVTPGDTIVLREDSYALPDPEPAPEGPVATAATGDSSGMQPLNAPSTAGVLSPAQDGRGAATGETHGDAAHGTEPATETNDPDTHDPDAATGHDHGATSPAPADPEASAEDEPSDEPTDETEPPADAAGAPATGAEAAQEGADDGEALPVSEDAVEEAVALQTSDEPAAEDATEDEAASDEAAETTPTTPVGDFDWQDLGATTYSAQCAACHQATGQGVPGAFPPLAGHMPELYNAQGGRDYLIHVVLHGLQGPIEVNGTTYNGVMPPFGQLSDEQVAATLNHELSSWGNLEHLQDFSPITPEEVAALREEPRTAAEVLELRP